MTESTPEMVVEPAEEGSRFAVYDNGELRYLEGTFKTAAAARKAHPDAKGSRYSVRSV